MSLISNAWGQLKGVTRPPLSRPGSYLLSGAGGFSGGPSAAFAAHESIGWLFSVVNRIAEATAAAEWSLYQLKDNGRELIDDLTPPARHPFTTLWSRPNPWFTNHEFLEVTQQHLDLVGEAYWVIVTADGRTEPLELMPIRPDRMSPIVDRDGYPAGYLYRVGTEKIPLELDQVVYMRVPSPRDPWRGQSPVAAMMTDLEAERYSAQWNRNFFATGAEPGGVLEFPHELSDLEFEKLTQRWREQHQGVSNAHRVAIVEGGKWIDRKFSQRDMEWSGLRRFNRDQILGAFGMHAAILGVAENVNRANAVAAEYLFGRWVLNPRLVRLRDALNTQILPRFGDGLQADYEDPTPSDRAAEVQQAVYLWMSGLATFGESREMVGLGEVQGRGDDFVPIPQDPATPPSLPGPGDAGNVKGYIGEQRQWPAGLGAVEADIANDWEKRLAILRGEVIEFVEAAG